MTMVRPFRCRSMTSAGHDRVTFVATGAGPIDGASNAVERPALRATGETMLSLLLPLLLAQAASVPASAPVPACDKPAELPAAFAGWRSPGRVPAIGKAFLVDARDPATVRGLVMTAVSRPGRAALVPIEIATAGRSEEHTSELQSLMRTSYAGFCLKKKTVSQVP